MPPLSGSHLYNEVCILGRRLRGTEVREGAGVGGKVEAQGDGVQETGALRTGTSYLVSRLPVS